MTKGRSHLNATKVKTRVKYKAKIEDVNFFITLEPQSRISDCGDAIIRYYRILIIVIATKTKDYRRSES